MALFLIAPMIAVSMAPPAPPAITCETIPPILRLPDCAAATTDGKNRHNSSCVGLKSAYPARAKCCAWDYLRLSRASAKPFSRTPSMSALGQEQAFGPINAMSALPPKADIVQHGGDVALCQK